MAWKIKVTNTSLISPSYNDGISTDDRGERKQKLRVSAAAHMIWFVPYRTRLLFFSKPSLSSFDDVVANLKSSLARTLVKFYPLAGRLLFTETDHGPRMDVVCNDKGLLFIEAAASEVSIDDLAKNEVCGHFDGLPAALVQELSQSGGYNLSPPWSFDVPLFIVQVTRLCCGGICIAIKFNHQVLDGSGTWNFVKAWAEICSGKDISLKPVVMETPACIAVSDDPHNEHSEVPPGYRRYEHSDLIARTGTTAIESTTFEMRCYGFKKEMITKMKLANPGYTSFQLLTSLIWTKVCAARDGEEDGETAAVAISANSRGRIKSVPEGFVGMAAVYDRVSTKVSSLRDGNELRNGALLIKNKISELISEQGVTILSKIISRGGRDYGIFPDYGKNHLIVGSSFYFPVFNDFGFGKPVGATIVRVLEDGKLYYFPGREEGDVVAYVSLERSAMEKFHKAISTAIDPYK